LFPSIVIIDRVVDRLFTTAAEEAYEELAEQFRALQQANGEQAANFQAERDSLVAEVAHLRSALQGAESVADTGQERADVLERELQPLRAQISSDTGTRRILEARNTELLEDTEKLRSALADALADATEQARRADKAVQELSQVEAEYQDVKTLEERHALRIAALLEDQTTTLRKLEDARSKGEDLKSQIESAYSESEGMRRALEEARKEKDRLLRAQASEHDRIIRDHIAEADGDRAVLEHQFSEFKTTIETSEKKLKDARSQMEVALADAKVFREEVQRVERELRETKHAEAALRADLRDGRASQSGYEQRIEESDRLIAQLVDVAIQFRNSHVKATATGLALSSHPTSGKPQSAANTADSIIVPHPRHAILGPQDEPSPIDPSDPQAALEILRAIDHDHLLDAVNKTGSTIRKWQKQCKEYRDRSKGKISFRNFAKGDLALFLPTKNSESKPWAAFNGACR
jgi:autophagy-related protein 11